MDHGEKNLKQEYLAEESWQIQEHEKNLIPIILCLTLKAKLFRFEYWLYNLLPVWPWTSFLMFSSPFIHLTNENRSSTTVRIMS